MHTSPKIADKIPQSSGLKRIRVLSHILDNAIPIPGTRYRIGLDPILGLIPGGGDVLGAILSIYIVIEAARFGLPRATLIRMVFNLLLETVVGALPILGDIFDVAWKANARNMTLLETHLANPHPNQAADRRFLTLLLAGLALTLVGVIILAGLILVLLIKAANH
ncbi:MAG: DUF4112 domain-containing protein [Cyanothece sp. SIO1E1]|nr:DUF4112 domain-containing protein [Cyanothece sp. SIO1E1]